ncbi:MAG: hypothetical protein M4579_000076 [Chaenotheca gracillima]|nr:MAG: hypothetical protein M4579_000076 [Chaenotheca gracillima]
MASPPNKVGTLSKEKSSPAGDTKDTTTSPEVMKFFTLKERRFILMAFRHSNWITITVQVDYAKLAEEAGLDSTESAKATLEALYNKNIAENERVDGAKKDMTKQSGSTHGSISKYGEAESSTAHHHDLNDQESTPTPGKGGDNAVNKKKASKTKAQVKQPPLKQQKEFSSGTDPTLSQSPNIQPTPPGRFIPQGRMSAKQRTLGQAGSPRQAPKRKDMDATEKKVAPKRPKKMAPVKSVEKVDDDDEEDDLVNATPLSVMQDIKARGHNDFRYDDGMNGHKTVTDSCDSKNLQSSPRPARLGSGFSQVVSPSHGREGKSSTQGTETEDENNGGNHGNASGKPQQPKSLFGGPYQNFVSQSTEGLPEEGEYFSGPELGTDKDMPPEGRQMTEIPGEEGHIFGDSEMPSP